MMSHNLGVELDKENKAILHTCTGLVCNELVLRSSSTIYLGILDTEQERLVMVYAFIFIGKNRMFLDFKSNKVILHSQLLLARPACYIWDKKFSTKNKYLKKMRCLLSFLGYLGLDTAGDALTLEVPSTNGQRNKTFINTKINSELDIVILVDSNFITITISKNSDNKQARAQIFQKIITILRLSLY
ncbi:hypothetical protein PHYBLDRAFT_167804 [Phycomyces blakesleeanus NRRL 1555(-)]|uniref:Uncharacterized protein n=1 Tax=Phycomyces blakesleeanus (strain ATCC 8743b / DSM 1359 / FGSC 10004 / NBRC 33097 / NRRL 1555) TaxID=763407 RepID=A0A162NHV0_PHYB8|nr:hypothetical protein PHYBLDRAFT_167804 [Phycomyces blakesleeanus NRRL 1555(-)]OAD74388.1 hypothetical protein PHYBLDRAFT_167804 [Phycomyces blakesleeanus NRRL 1555(-)]|eukprot:XP_018292428.1 hypothetical protein PHYBLDRAFT_167804 [Phycomyces blakesleeanus NRRL 1555(-)]